MDNDIPIATFALREVSQHEPLNRMLISARLLIRWLGIPVLALRNPRFRSDLLRTQLSAKPVNRFNTVMSSGMMRYEIHES